MPLYNKEKFVADAIGSVLVQAFADFELIIVDDASSDSSLEVARQFQDKRIRIISHERNLGLSSARNTGIAASQTALIAFLDADDLWKPDFLTWIIDLDKKFPEAGVLATAYEEWHGKVNLSVRINLDWSEKMGIVPDFFEAALFQPIFCFISAAVRRRVFDDVGMFDPEITFGEDTDFMIRALQNHKLAFYNKPCAVYRMQSQNQITARPSGALRFTDFDKYDDKPGSSFAKYLDANRYFIAMKLRIAGDSRFDDLVRTINRENLSAKQRLMLLAPLPLVQVLQKLKNSLLKSGVRLTTFS